MVDRLLSQLVKPFNIKIRQIRKTMISQLKTTDDIVFFVYMLNRVVGNFQQPDKFIERLSQFIAYSFQAL